jgi:hypothetical protein
MVVLMIFCNITAGGDELKSKITIQKLSRTNTAIELLKINYYPSCIFSKEKSAMITCICRASTS